MASYIKNNNSWGGVRVNLV